VEILPGDVEEDANDPNSLAAYLTSGSLTKSQKKRQEPSAAKSSALTVVREKEKARAVVKGVSPRRVGPAVKAIKRRVIETTEKAESEKQTKPVAAKLTLKNIDAVSAPSVRERNMRTRSGRNMNNSKTEAAAPVFVKNGNDGDKEGTTCDVFTADDFLAMMTDFGQKEVSPTVENTNGAVVNHGGSSSKVKPAVRASTRTSKIDVVPKRTSAVDKKQVVVNSQNVRIGKKRVTIGSGGDKSASVIVRWQKMQSTVRRAAFACSCRCVFTTKLSLVHHRRRFHVPGVFACTECTSANRAFCSRLSLAMHHRRNHSEQRFVCKRCGRGFRAEAEFRRHKKLHDIGRSSYACKTCLKRYFMSGHLERHEATHAEEERAKESRLSEALVCWTCRKSFQTSESYKLHRKRGCIFDAL